MCKIQCVLSQLQLSATNLQNTILSGNEEEASNQMNEFFSQLRNRQQELNSATESLRVTTYSETQETTTTTSTGTGATSTAGPTNNTDASANANQPNQGAPNIQNPFVPPQIQDTINNILSSIFRPPQ